MRHSPFVRCRIPFLLIATPPSLVVTKWAKNPKWKERLGTALFSIGMSFLMGLISFYVLVPNLSPPALPPATPLPVFLFFAGIAVGVVIGPLSYGAIMLPMVLRTPREVGVAASAAVFRFWRSSRAVEAADLAEMSCGYSPLRGSWLKIRMLSGKQATVRGVPPEHLEGLVCHLEQLRPELARSDPWAHAELPAGRVLTDPRLSVGPGQSLRPGRGAWATPCPAMRGYLAWTKGYVGAIIVVVPLLAFAAYGSFSFAILLATGASAAVLFLLIIATGFLQTRAASHANTGRSILPLPPGIHRGVELEGALRTAVIRTGMIILREQRHSFLILPQVSWKLSGRTVLRIGRNFVVGGDAVELRASGRNAAPEYSRLKGNILDQLALSPPSGGEGQGLVAREVSVPQAQATGGVSDKASRWNVSTLPDGSVVPDGALILGDASARVAWSSRAPEFDRVMAVLILPALFVLVYFLGNVTATVLAMNSSQASLFALGLSLGLLAPVIWLVRYQIAGKAGFCMISLPPAFRAESAIDPLIRAAAANSGLTVKAVRKGALWTRWSMDSMVTARFMPPTEGETSQLSLQTYRNENADLHRKFKGNLLDLVGAGPSRTRSPQIQDQPSLLALAPDKRRMAMPRAVSPARLPEPAEWGVSLRPGISEPVVDALLPPSGADDAPIGWWASAPRSKKMNPMMRFAVWAATIPGLLLGALFWIGANSSGHPNLPGAVDAIIVVSMVGGAVLFAVVLRGASRRFDRERYEGNPRSILRLDLAGNDTALILRGVDGALGATAPGVARSSAPAGAEAHWKDSDQTLSVTLWREQPGKLPLLELASTRAGVHVSQVKGAIEAALYGV